MTSDLLHLIDQESRNDSADLVSWSICLQGRVQGLGVRPAIAKQAVSLGLTGHVQNTSEGLQFVLEGRESAVCSFVNRLTEIMPAASEFRICSITKQTPTCAADFQIRQSQETGRCVAEVPNDLTTCAECLMELMDPANRRFRDPFLSCTCCGPRYSIIHSMPYDRTETAMADFRMCETCRQEYGTSGDRRFHAQTVTCRHCGPQLLFHSKDSTEVCQDDEGLHRASELIRQGAILAVKGLGGYQLICDATNETAVSRLRQAKRRDTKPLAVMVDQTSSLWKCLSRPVTQHEQQLLTSPENPIVLLDAMHCTMLAPGVSRGLNSLGLFLSTTPIHAMLLRDLQRPLVVTSGNRGSEPLAYNVVTAHDELLPMADGWLTHNREIVRPVDDSVVRPVGDTTVTIRAGRGIAPLLLKVKTRHSILAVGGEQKVACAISNGMQTVLGPHIGEMSSLAGRQRFVEQAAALRSLYRCVPKVIVHDLHSDYFTTRWSAEQNVRTLAVQHHHAHVVAGMLEHDLLNQEVLGVAFDGSGLGPDGTVWGGEFLLATTAGFRRVASLMPFTLPGGDAAVREPWRVALALLHVACPEMTASQIVELVHGQCGIDRGRIQQMQQLIRSDVCPVTTSMGRLFDGIASLILGVAEAEFEGEPAMRLESTCFEKVASFAVFSRTFPFEERVELLPSAAPQTEFHVDWRPIVRHVVTAICSSTGAREAAWQFHQFVAAQVNEVVRRFPGYPVVLSGGCFQNRILTELVLAAGAEDGRTIFPPGRIPPNDGGLAAGQLAIATAILEAEQQDWMIRCA